MSYIIAMKFISWVIAIWMWIGVEIIDFCRRDLNNSKISSLDRMLSKMIVDDYNSRNLLGRVLITLFYGARIMSLPFKLRGKRK